MNMGGHEGFTAPKIKERPTDEAENVLDRGEKIEIAEKSVVSMFNDRIEAKEMITSFEYPRN